MNKSRLLALVIDDDARREADYQRFFDSYNNMRNGDFFIAPRFISDGSEAEQAISKLRQPFFVVLDMVLTGWMPNELDALHLQLRRVRPPLFALSLVFNEDLATSTYLKIVGLLGNSFVPMLHWENMVMEGQDAQKPLKGLLSTFSINLRAIMQADWLTLRGDDENIKLLHLSDLHFSSPKVPRSTHLFQIGVTLAQEDLKADLVCITGDCIDKGEIRGYDLASEWVEGMFKSDWLNVSEDSKSIQPGRIFVCPGNHDYSESLGIAGYAVRDPNAVSGYAFKDIGSDAPHDIHGTHWKYGMAPFLRFHERLTGWRVSHGDYPGYRVVSAYSSAGLHLVELWGEEYRCGKYPSPLDQAWYSEVLSKFAADIVSVAAEGDCVVVLIHRFKDVDPADRYTLLRDQLTALGKLFRVIVLCGHYHEDDSSAVGPADRVLRIQAGSIDENTRPTDQLAKVGIITLSREKGLVSGCRVDKIEYRGGGEGWSRTVRHDSFTWTTNGWRKV